MEARSSVKIDPFILALLATLCVAVVVPCHGAAVPAFNALATVLIAMMFFLQGAKLSRAAVVEGLRHWRLQGLILLSTFALFPLVGLAMRAGLRIAVPGALSEESWTGLLFLCALPSTVQSSIAFTSIARGNVAAAVCAATASNILGLFITPLLVGLLLGRHGAVSADAVVGIVLQLLVPFIAGQILQPWIGGWVARHKKLITFSDRGSILVVVYTAFSAAITGGLWHILSPAALLWIVGVDLSLLALVLLLTWGLARAGGFSREDEIAIQFCGSKKSLATGVPMAKVLFAGSTAGLIVIPLMIFHQVQLLACAALARRYAARPADIASAGRA